MPTDMSKYPKDWKEIRNRILLRAGGNEDDPRVGARCEKCNIRNYEVDWVSHDSYSEAKLTSNYNRLNDLPAAIVVLTIAHIYDPDPQNVDENNLAALCQKCHNSHDVQYRKRNRATTRRARIVENGQAVLI